MIPLYTPYKQITFNPCLEIRYFLWLKYLHAFVQDEGPLTTVFKVQGEVGLNRSQYKRHTWVSKMKWENFLWMKTFSSFKFCCKVVSKSSFLWSSSNLLKRVGKVSVTNWTKRYCQFFQSKCTLHTNVF